MMTLKRFAPLTNDLWMQVYDPPSVAATRLYQGIYVVKRQEIIDSVGCPSCKAEAGSPCWNGGGGGKPRKKIHPARAILATSGNKKVNRKAKRTQKVKNRVGFYSTWEWKKIRYETMKRFEHRCQCCGWQPSDTPYGRLVVDHIKPRSKHPELALDINNLQVLCNDCNMGKSNIYEDDFRVIGEAFKGMVH